MTVTDVNEPPTITTVTSSATTLSQDENGLTPLHLQGHRSREEDIDVVGGRCR